MADTIARVSIVGKCPIMISYDCAREKYNIMNKNNDVAYFVNSKYISETIFAGMKRIKSDFDISIAPVVLDGMLMLEQFTISGEEFKSICLNICEGIYVDNNLQNKAISVSWKADFQIQWNEANISKDTMGLALMCAGSYIGLGDARNFGFGRFWIKDMM